MVLHNQTRSAERQPQEYQCVHAWVEEGHLPPGLGHLIHTPIHSRAPHPNTAVALQMETLATADPLNAPVVVAETHQSINYICHGRCVYLCHDHART